MNILKIKPFILMLLFAILGLSLFGREYIIFNNSEWITERYTFIEFIRTAHPDMIKYSVVNLNSISYILWLISLIHLIEGLYQLRKK